MKTWIALFLAAFVAGATAQSCPPCRTMKWANCDGSPCVCPLPVSENMTQTLDCDNLIPKCFLMGAEMYRARKGLSTRSGTKPTEDAIVDNDGIYDPICENSGRFKAKQCNHTQECWCVNSAGVRRTDKGDVNMKCDKLVETFWIRLQLTHLPVSGQVDATSLKTALGSAMNARYKFDASLLQDFQYDPTARMILADIKKPKGDRAIDLATTAYYMEKDVKALPLFTKQDNFTVPINGQNMLMDSILVYYVDEEPPTMTMRYLSGGIIAVIVVVVLAVVIGLLVLFFARKRLTKYNKAQQREMEPM
ncbi:epithelial cell adhesion molecule [Betta splendens]|uniref:Epithelial cell adhesion molecule n=1 Tax=Betta splendens TaxID=158456 RepID=A0A6P7PGP6_BETSP|nr:epithelial cell adhesion molecule [Betta splendens]